LGLHAVQDLLNVGLVDVGRYAGPVAMPPGQPQQSSSQLGPAEVTPR
jgi:hypothetical protein